MIGTDKKEAPAGRPGTSENRVYSETDNTEYSPDGAKSQYELYQGAENAAAEVEDWTLQEYSNGYNWLKFRTNLLDTPKFIRLSDQAKAVYFETYLLAGKSDAGGLIVAADNPIGIEDIALLLHRQPDAVSEGLAELQAAGLVSVEAGRVTVCNFTKEQGPAHADMREQWKARQSKRRERIKGELQKLEELQKIQAAEVLKNNATEPAKELKTTTKSKGLTRESRVTPPNEEVVVFSNEILDLWQDLRGKKFTANPAFMDMVTEWNAQGVTLPEVREVFLRNGSAADTPLYFRNVVLNHKAKAPAAPAEDYPGANKFRALAAVYNGTESANNNGAK